MQEPGFTKLLMGWNKVYNKRKMPWKGEQDPYKVWLSEIILQQTRVEQGWTYYEKFVQHYPTITQLANAKDEAVFKLWEGLGYYTRCKNLLHTARFIQAKYNGSFPSNYEEIEALKGVGPYTAAAIASFCFGLPYAVTDGNVFRVLSRVFGIETPINTTAGKKQFSELAAKMLDKKNAGTYNQAIMDFGATVCKPMLPLCSSCPLNKICVAFKTASVSRLPVKEKVLKKKLRWFSYIIFYAKGKMLVRKRTAKDIWQNLFEFYLIETVSNPQWHISSVADYIKTQLAIDAFEVASVITAQSQQLTHQTIKGYFIKVHLKHIPAVLQATNNQWIYEDEIKLLPFPAFINQFLQNKTPQPILLAL